MSRVTSLFCSQVSTTTGSQVWSMCRRVRDRITNIGRRVGVVLRLSQTINNPYRPGDHNPTDVVGGLPEARTEEKEKTESESREGSPLWVVTVCDRRRGGTDPNPNLSTWELLNRTFGETLFHLINILLGVPSLTLVSPLTDSSLVHLRDVGTERRTH